jgi:hypothetical protein
MIVQVCEGETTRSINQDNRRSSWEGRDGGNRNCQRKHKDILNGERKETTWNSWYREQNWKRSHITVSFLTAKTQFDSVCTPSVQYFHILVKQP